MLRRRPLLRAAATTAVVAGTATAVSGRVSRRQQARYQSESAAMNYGDAPPAVSEPEAAGAPTSPGGLSMEALEELKQLAALKDQGVLTEEEFASQKARLLA